MPQVIINFRDDKKTKELLQNLTKEIPDGISRLMRLLVKDYLNSQKFNSKISLELNQEISNCLLEKQFKEQKQKHKRKLFYYYLISNTLKAIYKLSSSYLVNSGELNMDIVNKIIDSAEEVYNTYPEDIKNDLKNEFDNLKLLKDKHNLIEKMRLLRLIALKKQIKEIEEK